MTMQEQGSFGVPGGVQPGVPAVTEAAPVASTPGAPAAPKAETEAPRAASEALGHTTQAPQAPQSLQSTQSAQSAQGWQSPPNPQNAQIPGAPVVPPTGPNPAVPAAAAAPKRRGWIVALVLVVGLLVLAGIGVYSCASALDRMGGGAAAGHAPNTVAVITLDGTIGYDGSANSPRGLKLLLDEAADDPNIKAVVLRVNSGGGTAAAGEEMSLYLAAFEKPVVVSSAAINASAAYMISSQADYIFVQRTTDIGSIGTLLQHTDLSELMEKLGIDIEYIKSADSKDSSTSYRPLTDEERKRYQKLVDDINEAFIDLVAEGRGMDVEEVRKLADGMAWAGEEAISLNIADGIGTFEDACEKAAELGGCADDYEVEDLSINSSSLADLVGLLGTTQRQDGADAELFETVKELLEYDRSVR